MQGGRGEGSKTYFPVLTSGLAGHLAQVLVFHPLILGGLANAAGFALHGGTAADGFGRLGFVQAVQRAVDAAWRSDG